MYLSVGAHAGKACEVCTTWLTSQHRFWECQLGHNTCHTCVAECIDSSSGVVKCPRQGCGKKLVQTKTSEQTDSKSIYIFVDDSNMWIEAKKLSSKRLKLKTREDPRIRFDIGKVTDAVARGREVVHGKLYGSEPPTIDSVWRKIEDYGWKVVTTKSSYFTRKQKQVDQQLVADVTELVSDASIQRATIIIVSGDADVIPAIRAGLKKKWRFEVWMWAVGISNSLKQLERESPECVQVVELDEFLRDITFTNFKFNMAKFEPHLKSQTAVITGVNFKPTEAWERELTGQLGWPFQFCWIGEKKQDPSEYQDIILVFASVKAEDDGKNAKEHFDGIFQELKRRYGEQATTYPLYQQKYHRKDELTISNRFDRLASIDDQLSGSVEGGSSDEELSGTNSTGNGARGFTPLHGASGCSGYGSVPSDYTSCPSAPLSRATSQSSVNSPFPDTSNGDSNGAGFRTVVPRRTRRPSQQFSEPCRYRSRCRKGLKCSFYHSDDEREFFKNKRKRLMCNFGQYCNRRPKCEFAHSSKEAFCCKCHKLGHVQEKCTSKNE